MPNLELIHLGLRPSKHKKSELEKDWEYTLVYRRESFYYRSRSERTACINAIIKRTPYNSVLAISDPRNSQVNEAIILTKILRHKINKPKNQKLNIRVLGDPLPANAQEQESNAKKEQTTLLNTTKELLTTFPWSLFSGLKTNDKLTPKKLVKNFDETGRKLENLDGFFLGLARWGFYGSLIGLIALGATPLIAIGGACLFVVGCLLSFQTSRIIEKIKTTTDRLSDDFIYEGLFQTTTAPAPVVSLPTPTPPVLSATPPRPPGDDAAPRENSSTSAITPAPREWARFARDI